MSYVTELPNYTADSSGDTIELWGRDQSMAPNGVFSPGRGMRLEDWWDIAAADLTDFLDVVGGITELWGSVFWPRMIPLRNKLYPIALATDASFKLYTLERASGVLSKDRARIRIAYEVPTYPIEGTDAFLSYRKMPGKRYLPITGATASSGVFDEPPIKPNATNNWYVTLHRLTVDPSATLDPYNGYCNDATWRGFPAQTLLFHGAQVEPEARIGGFETFQATCHFEYSPIGWNTWPNSLGNPVTATWNGGDEIALPTDFSALFGF